MPEGTLERCVEESGLTNHKADELLREQTMSEQQSLISGFKQNKLEFEARKNWDRFYKRNSDHFFKDRNWTKREIEELCGEDIDLQAPLTMIEAGCGCGNTIFPMIKFFTNWQFCGVDFSQNAIALLEKRASQLEIIVHAEVLDLTSVSPNVSEIPSADLVSLIFVLSSISPKHHITVIRNLRKMLKPAGSVIFRDYGAFDHAMLRFNNRSKIDERFYARQDGTRAYYFFKEEVAKLFEECGFETIKCKYVYRKTKNIKEQICVDRVFIEGRFKSAGQCSALLNTIC